jgi:Tol biopolymer transport system component
MRKRWLARGLAAAVFGLLVGALTAAPALAAFPGKNGRIAFARDGDIWTVRPDGTGERRLTRSPAYEDGPAWSADGRWIAFVRHGPYDPNVEPVNVLFRMRADGTQLRPIASGTYLQSPTWAPNGRRIAYTVETEDGDFADLVVAGLDGSRKWTLKSSFCERRYGFEDCGFADPVWGPYGGRIAFDWLCIDCSEIAVVNAADGSGYKDITHNDHRYTESLLDWGPYGRRFAIASYDWIEFEELFGFIDHTGENLDVSPDHPAVAGYDAAWSPNGRRLAVRTGEEIVTMNLDGTRIRSVTGDGYDLNWQPLPR